MGKAKTFETATKVTYGDEEFDVSGEVYVEIEDKTEAVDKLFGVPEGEKDAAKEWITYNALINSGHFVSRPSVPEPKLAKTFDEPESTLDDVPFYPTRGSVWTQEKILANQEKLLVRQEKQLRREEAFFKRQRELEAKRKAAQAVKTETRQFYHEDGTPYTYEDYQASWMMLTVIIFVGVVMVIICSQGG